MRGLPVLAIVVLCTCVASAQWQHSDVLKIQRTALDRVASNLVDLAAAYGVEGDVVDYGVVGSYACGVARVSGPNPSDIDLVVFIISNAAAINTRFIREDEHRTYMRWQRRMQDALHFPHPVGMGFQDHNFFFPRDPDYIFYSLKTHTMYGRTNGQPRNVKLILYSNTFANVDRPLYIHHMTTTIARLREAPWPLFRSNDVLVFGLPEKGTVLFTLPVVSVDTSSRD